MKPLFILPILFLTININAQINESDYSDKCDTEFQRLLVRLNKSDKEIWENKRSDIIQEYVRISQEKQLEEKIYRDINAGDIYAYQYLNAVNNFLLPSKTRLINSLADKVVYQTIEKKIRIKLSSFDSIFNEYANTNNASKFENAYFTFFNIKSEYENLKLKKDTLFFTIYEVKDNVYSEPDSSNSYVIYNWEKRILQLQQLYLKLNAVETEIQSKKFIVLKDPNPILPVLFQICTLLIIIANSFISFPFHPTQFKILCCVVILSLVTSVILLIISEETILNLSINIFVPGITYIFYYRSQKKKRKKQNGTGNAE